MIAGPVKDAGGALAVENSAKLTLAEGSMELSAKTGMHGGEVVSKKTLDRLEKILKKQKCTLYRDADRLLDARKSDGLFTMYPNGCSAIVLRSNTTKYLLYHELKHFGDFRRMGHDAFFARGECENEQSVCRYMMKQTFLNPLERSNAITYAQSFQPKP